MDHEKGVSWARFFGLESSATWKLAEARFFLQKSQEALEFMEANIWWGNPPAQILIGFYVSAFLSAARSVTFALQNEAKQTYDTRFPQWVSALSEEDQEIFKLMNQKRVEEVHQSGVRTIIKEELVFGECIPGYGKIAVPHFRLKNREIAVNDAFVSYLSLLENLVESIVQQPGCGTEPPPP